MVVARNTNSAYEWIDIIALHSTLTPRLLDSPILTLRTTVLLRSMTTFALVSFKSLVTLRSSKGVSFAETLSIKTTKASAFPAHSLNSGCCTQADSFGLGSSDQELKNELFSTTFSMFSPPNSPPLSHTCSHKRGSEKPSFNVMRSIMSA